MTRLGVLEATVTIIEGDPDAGIAKSDDVRPSVACEVGEEPRMPVYTPISGPKAEAVVDDALGCLEATVTIIEGDPDAGIAKSDDVRPSVACEIGEKSRMPVHTPFPSIEAEVVVNDGLGCLKTTVTIIEGDPHPPHRQIR